MEHSEYLAFYGAALIAAGAACQWLAWRMNLPAILPLLLLGLLLGPGLGALDPDAVLGNLLFPFVSLGVAVILFEGSLTLRFSDIGSVTRIIRNLTSIGVLVTCGVMAAAAYYLTELSWPLALLFGALVTVTGPTVIIPMLRSIKVTERIANILRWEGILIDPIGAVLAVLMFEFIHTGGAEARSLLAFGKVVTIGAIWGIAGGAVLAQVLKRNWLPDYLVNYFALAFVLLIFTGANLLGEESGLIAVTVMGIMLANTRGVDVRQLLSFKEDLTLVLISVLFILLAARLQLDELQAILVPALWLLAVAALIARPLAVWISALGTSVSLREKAMLAWVAPRGIVAAAVSSLFALRLEASGNEQAGLLVPLTFMIIIGTVVIQSLTAGWVASRLGLSSRDEEGVLMVDANKVSLALGVALHEAGIKVKVVDSNRSGLQEARMQKLDTFYGNPLSEHAERYMDLTGYTHMFAMSRQAEFNAVVCAKYRYEFNTRRVYAIQTNGGEDDEGREGLSTSLRFNRLFPRGTSWTKLASLLSQGHSFRSTKLTDEFNMEAFHAKWGKDAINLFALNRAGKLQVRIADGNWQPHSGWTLISLVPPEAGEGNGKRARQGQAAAQKPSLPDSQDNGDSDEGGQDGDHTPA
jgi:NhaP-type Na+/H+ or K+/H+ antiporter